MFSSHPLIYHLSLWSSFHNWLGSGWWIHEDGLMFGYFLGLTWYYFWLAVIADNHSHFFIKHKSTIWFTWHWFTFMQENLLARQSEKYMNLETPLACQSEKYAWINLVIIVIIHYLLLYTAIIIVWNQFFWTSSIPSCHSITCKYTFCTRWWPDYILI